MQTPERAPLTISVVARRWFQRTYGNTYHSVQVTVNGSVIGYVPFTYGYGSQWEQTAIELLKAKFPEYGGEFSWPRMRAEKLGDSYFSTVCDVQRKKDLAIN